MTAFLDEAVSAFFSRAGKKEKNFDFFQTGALKGPKRHFLGTRREYNKSRKKSVLGRSRKEIVP